MKRGITGAVLLLLALESSVVPHNVSAAEPVAIAIHAGAGTIRREDLSPERETEIRQTSRLILR